MIFILPIIAIAGVFIGYSNFFRIEKMNQTVLLNWSLIIFSFFTILIIAHSLGYFTQDAGAWFMMSLYSLIAGFFTGYAIRLLKIRSKAGKILYINRSFWTDHAPNLIAILIILYGIYRTSILTDDPVTGIRLTSGLSLMAFGIFGWTLKIVPEFRDNGILLFDKIVKWSHLISWSWHSEEVIMLEYLSNPATKDEHILQFLTNIPDDDRIRIEDILNARMEEFSDERKKILFKEDD
jgi:hypothetical protein